MIDYTAARVLLRYPERHAVRPLFIFLHRIRDVELKPEVNIPIRNSLLTAVVALLLTEELFPLSARFAPPEIPGIRGESSLV